MNQQLFTKAQNVVNYTNSRLATWYESVKEDFGINGFGVAKFNSDNNSIVIEYSENGQSDVFVVEDWIEEGIEYTFNVWMEIGVCIEC